jgi:TRAP-type mannitol/chloroaromatic compound transport system permease small subunit
MMARIRQLLESLSELTGVLVAWLTVAMVLVTFVVVVLRYAFDIGWISMQESVTWMHAAVFMLGAAYTLKHDEHVRVDILYRGMTERRKALVNLSGTVLFLFPVAIFLAISSWDYVYTSWLIHESSREAGGLPYPFISLLKSLIPATAGLLILQGVANAIGAILTLMGQAPSDSDRETSLGNVI